MKKFLKKLKIKHKLIIIIMSTVIISLLLLGSVLIVTERYLAKQSMADKLMTISRIIADRSTAALSFKDEKVAGEVLSALENETSVELACIYDEMENVFSVYGFSLTMKCPTVLKGIVYRFFGDHLEIYQAVTLDDEVIGTVYILATLDKLNDRLLNFVMLVILMIVVAGVVAYYLAKRQQEIISKPIIELTEVTREISISGDYTTRLPMGSKDEIGALNIAFNKMLEQIYKRQTERDKAEKALSEREQDLVVTLNSIGDAVIVTDVNGKITRMNPVAEQLTGWSFEEANKQSINNVFPIIDATTQEPIDNPVNEVVGTGETVFHSNHITLIKKTGKKIHIANSAAPIRNERKEILGMILVFNDVTEQYKLRESAAKSKRDLQAIMDNSPSVIHVEDNNGRFIFANKGFSKIFNVHEKKLIDKSISEIFEHEVYKNILKHNNEILSTGVAFETEEIILQKNVEHTYSTIKFPLYDEEDNIYAVCNISTDITERLQQEEQLRRSQKMDALGKLTGGIAHDYNNLLGVIIGYADLLSEKLVSDSKLKKYVKYIEHAAKRGSKLTKKLLSFTRYESVDENLLNINKLILDQQLMLEKTLTARIKLKIELAENIWPIWIDSGDLEDAIINMCINASHAIIESGEIAFETKNISLNELDAGVLHLTTGDYVKMSITDSGSGMDKSIREKIFDPFFSTKGEAGTGLGLSQVYGFVKRSGGGIEVESEIGKGTRFNIYFPRSEAVLSDIKNSAETKKKNVQGNESILVVDDEPALVDLAKDILVGQGYKVFTASSGVSALEILEKEKIDLMLSDVIMPNMDGYQLAEKIQKKYPDLIVQLVSGFTDNKDENIIDKKSYNNLLHKPYTANELLEHVSSLLGHSYFIDDVDDNLSDKSVSDTAESYQQKKQNNQISSKTILIMDDEEDIRDLFVINLEALGYRAITASNSDNAIEKYKQSLKGDESIDALILDLNIPGSLRGDEVAKKIREINMQVKIIVCSGDASGFEMIDYKKYGFDGALEKTFNRQKIKSLLDELF